MTDLRFQANMLSKNLDYSKQQMTYSINRRVQRQMLQ